MQTDQNILHTYFRLGTEEVIRKGQTQVQHIEYHQIHMSQRLAESAAGLLKKDMLVYVEGKFSTRSYKEGPITRYVTEIIAQHLKLIGRASDFQATPK